MKNSIKQQIRNKLINKESGQTLVIIVFVMMVGLTVGLYLMNRTTTDISMTTKNTDATRAFNAAEAGVEEALRNPLVANSPVPISPLDSDAKFTPLVISLGGSTAIYPLSKQTATNVGEAFTVWLIGHNDATGMLDESTTPYKNPQIAICFTNNSDSPTPAIEANFIYNDAGIYKSSYAAYDPKQSSRTTTSVNFKNTNNAVCTGYESSYDYQAMVDFSADFGVIIGNVTPIALRIRPIYGSSSIAVVPQLGAGNTLPKQGNDITSTGTAGETARKLNVQNPYPVLPFFMDYAVYSYGNITK